MILCKSGLATYRLVTFSAGFKNKNEEERQLDLRWAKVPLRHLDGHLPSNDQPVDHGHLEQDWEKRTSPSLPLLLLCHWLSKIGGENTLQPSHFVCHGLIPASRFNHRSLQRLLEVFWKKRSQEEKCAPFTGDLAQAKACRQLAEKTCALLRLYPRVRCEDVASVVE